MNIFIGNDHGGYHLKKVIMRHLEDTGHHVINVGSDSTEIVRYPYYAGQVANAVANQEADFGILICNTGLGMSMAANKYKGVRAAVVSSEETARLTREHNNANVLCLGGKFVSDTLAVKLVDIFLNTPFSGGRHAISLGLIDELESENHIGAAWSVFDRELEAKRDAFYCREKQRPVPILLDTDMLTDCDDVAALAMLLNLEKHGYAKILGMTVSSKYPMSAPVVQAVNTYYNRADIPVGAPKNGRGAYRPDSCFLDKVSAEFPHTLQSNDDAPDAVEVMRKALADAQDHSVVLVTIGYMTNLETLLKSQPDAYSELDGQTLVKQKVAEWVCMGGNFPDDSAADNVNFTRDPQPALYAIQNFPGKITFVGREIGHNIYVGDDFHDLPKENPLRRAYELHRGRYGENWDHHTADPSTVLYAVFGCSRFFEVQSGSMNLHDDCSFEWDPEKPSNMSYILQKEDRKKMAAVMNAIIMDDTTAIPDADAF